MADDFETQYPALTRALSTPMAPAAPKSRRSWLSAGLSSGIDNTQAIGGAAIAEVGNLLNIDRLRDFGEDIARRNFAEAAANGRPDLQSFPSNNLTKVPAWLGYQTAQQIPNLAAIIAMSRLPGIRSVGNYLPKSAKAAGAFVPEILGGGGAAAGAVATFAQRKAGIEFAKRMAALTAASYPMAAGSLYGEAMEAGDVSRGDALKIAGMAVPYAAMEALQPKQLERFVSKGLSGKLMRRVATGAVAGAATEAPTEAIQTAMEQHFRPDLTSTEKMHNIVEAAIAGGAVGGVFGGMGGIRQMKRADPAKVTDDDMKAVVDSVLNPNAPPQLPMEQGGAPLEAPTNPRPFGQRTTDGSRYVVSDEDLMKGLAAIQQRAATTNARQGSLFGAGEPDGAVDDRLVQEQINRELDIRQQEAIQSVAQDRRQFEAPLLNPQDGSVMERQMAPRATPAATEVTPEVTAAREFAASLFGTSRSKVAQQYAASLDVTSRTDVATRIIDDINRFDEAGKNPPGALLTAGKNLGLFDEKGAPRNIATELDAAVAKHDQMMAQVKETGQGLAQANAFFDKTVKPLQDKYEMLRDAMQRAEELRAARQAEAATAPAEQSDAGPRPSTAEEAAQVLAGAPPVTPQMTFEQRYLNRNTFQRSAVPAAEVTEAAPVAAPADLSGSRFKDLQQRFANRGDARTRAAVVENATLQERFASRGAETQVQPAGPGIVTAQTPTAVTTQTPPVAGAAKFVPTMDQWFASRGNVNRVGPPTTAQDIAQNSARAQVVEQLQQAKLARIAQDDSIGQDLKQAASEAQAMVQSNAPGATEAMTDVLAQYADRTGDIVFSRTQARRAPPMMSQRLERAMKVIGSKLPLVARNAVQVAETASQLPDVVLRAAERRGIRVDEIKGVLYDGKAYVVLDQISSEAELQEVINHEVFGHGGARALFGDQRQAVLSTAFKMAGGVEGLRRIAREFGVEAQLNRYIPVRELNDADKVALVDELLAQAAGVATGKFRTAVLAWVSAFKNMLNRALRTIGLGTVADRLSTFDDADLAAMLVQMRNAVESGGRMDGAMAFKLATPQGMLESTRNLTQTALNVQNWFRSRDWSELSLEANKLHLYTSSAGHIVDFFGKLFERPDGTNPLREWWNANVVRGVVEQRFAHLVKIGYTAYEMLQKNSPTAALNLGKLMGYTFYDIDPRKTWEQQNWLHSKKNADGLKAHVAAANKIYNDGRQNGLAEVYDQFVDTNEAMHFAQQAISLYNLLITEEGVSKDIKDTLISNSPMDRYLAAAGTYDNAKASREFWLAETNKLVTLADNYVATQRGLGGMTDAQMAKRIEISTSALHARTQSIRNEQNAMAQAPYFHLGRFGNWVLSFHLAPGADGKISSDTMEKVAEAFDKAGIQGVEIPPDAERNNVFIRFETKAQMDEAAKVARDLAQKGIVRSDGDKAVATFNKENEALVNRFELNQSPEWVRRLMEETRATRIGDTAGLTDEQSKMVDQLNAAFDRHLTQFFLNLLPDTAINKVMVHRNYVPGFSEDMIRSYLFRTQVGGRALANLYASPKMTAARVGMKVIAKEARTDPNSMKSIMIQNVANEMFKRDANRPMILGHNFIDTWRAINHAYFLGMSPAYAAVNMTQVGVLLWPELAKRYGFVNSAKAIAKVTPIAMKIMAFTLKEGGKLGWKNLPDASITREVLQHKELGLTEAQADFVLRVVNSGLLDIGSQSRELGRVVEGQADSRTELALRYASAFGYYTEMASRLIAALSARELHGGTNKDEKLFSYVDQTVRQSMLSYETWNQARATGRMGLAGEFTPVMTSFMQYTFQLTEKLYREFHAAFRDAAKTPEEKKAAKRFLVGHLAAVTTLAGTLGMPMASVFAWAFDNLVDLFSDDDDEPMNITAAYRNFLSDMFGKDLGEVIARGVPRAIGIDISRRAGEQDMLPYLHMFSRLLTDRREWEDKIKDGALQTLGSPVGMLANIISGGDKIMSGDVMGGMIQMMPNAIKGPMNAFKLTTDGYVDGKGNALPMETGASDVLWQALGFSPARKAEYSEARGVQTSLKGDMIRKASQLREDLATALEDGDADRAREALKAAQRFDEKNPSFAVLPTIKSVLTSRARERARAAEAQIPLDIKPELADRSRFADFD